MPLTPHIIYAALPAPTRTIAASLRGFYLRSWRYGAETDRLVEQALVRESWSAEQWRSYQQERLAFVLHRAATQVPYYRQQWAQRRQHGDQTSSEQLENWDVLTKEAVRGHPRAFVADDCDTRRMFHEHTSGTTGKSLDLWWSRDTVRQWYALFEARWRRWYGVSRHDRWAILGGQLVTPVAQQTPPFWVWNSGLHQLYMSSYHLSEKLIPSYLDALKKYRITYLWGYTSSLYSIAQEVIRLGRRDLKFAVVITNAEPLYPYQREVIEAAFQCPVRETYGMSEIVANASECQFGSLHLWQEVGIVEVREQNETCIYNSVGDLICTGLLNADMPLIRYQVGDRGALADPNESCRCGRQLPLLKSIEGRIDDMLYTVDGRRIGRLDPIFKSHLPVREAQIIQETLRRVRVKYVPAPDFDASAAASLTERIRAYIGDIEVVLEPVVQIPRSSAGKFRAVVCNLPAEQKRELAQHSAVPRNL